MRGRLHTSRAALAAAGLAAAALVAASPAGAATTGKDPCGNTVTFVQPFLGWQDSDVYVLGPGGSFEPGTPSWTLAGGASIAAGNEPWKVGGSTNGYALSLPSGANATSRTMCVDASYPTLRFFLQNTGSPASTLRLDVMFRKQDGSQKVFTVGHFSGSSTWAPTPVTFFNPLANGCSTATVLVNFRLTVEGAGSWKVDDLYVDPVKHR